MNKVTRLTGGVPAEADLPQESVGQDLRAARLRRGDELSRISRALRIRKDYLEAIEADSPDRLPGRAYALGFLRSYADYLGLDSPTLVSRYKTQTVGQSETVRQVGLPPELERSRFAVAQAAVAVGVLALVVYGFYQFSQPGVSGRPGASSADAARSADHAVRHSPQKAQAGERKPAAADSMTALAAPAPVPGQQQVAVSEGQVFGAQNLGVHVVVRAHRLAHVLVQGFRGKVYLNRVLHPGDVYRVPNVVGLSLTTPNGGAVSLEVDGRDMGAAGRSGHITEALSLDPRAIADRKGVDGLYQGDKVTP
jgi:cytoskeleton protein RodZ